MGGQMQIQAVISDLGFNGKGRLMAVVKVHYRQVGIEKKRQTSTGYVDLTTWIEADLA